MVLSATFHGHSMHISPSLYVTGSIGSPAAIVMESSMSESSVFLHSHVVQSLVYLICKCLTAEARIDTGVCSRL